MTHAMIGIQSLAAAALLVTSSGCASHQRPQPPQEAQLVRAISPPARLEAPDYLPASARLLLRERMTAHARDMGQLMSAIMLLHYGEVHERAQAIAEDTRFARPMTGDASELNSALPERFFSLQEQLRTRSGALATAAAQTDALAVADAYGRLSETCVSCHATYRQGTAGMAASARRGR
jgi:cytochrome c556